MASVKYSTDSKEFQFFQDYWKFIQEYAVDDGTDEFWDIAIKKGDLLSRKYGNTAFCRELVLAHLTNVERKAKK